MKTLSGTANKIVPSYMTYYSEGWHCNSHDTFKSGSNIETLFDCYVFTTYDTFLSLIISISWTEFAMHRNLSADLIDNSTWQRSGSITNESLS